MEFDWDEHNIAHIAEHDVTPGDVEHILGHAPLRLGRGLRNGEERITYTGADPTGRILVVTTTLREDRVRVVTAFPASRKIRAWHKSLRGAG